MNRPPSKGAVSLGTLPLCLKRYFVISHLNDWVLGGSPGWHYFSVQPPAAVGVDEVSLYDQVLQHVLGLLLIAQHQPPEAVVDGERLQDGGPGD